MCRVVYSPGHRNLATNPSISSETGYIQLYQYNSTVICLLIDSTFTFYIYHFSLKLYFI